MKRHLVTISKNFIDDSSDSAHGLPEYTCCWLKGLVSQLIRFASIMLHAVPESEPSHRLIPLLVCSSYLDRLAQHITENRAMIPMLLRLSSSAHLPSPINRRCPGHLASLPQHRVYAVQTRP